MSRLTPWALGTATVLVLTAGLTGPAAQAEPAPAHERAASPDVVVVHAKPTDGHHGNSEATVELPAGGTASVVSPTLPGDATTAKVTVSVPLSETGDFKEVALALMEQPTPARRLLKCITMTAQIYNPALALMGIKDDAETYEALAGQLFLGRLEYCMRIAFLVTEVLNNPNARAASACGQAPIAIKEEVTKDSAGYHVSAAGPPTAKKKNAGVKVSCKVVSETKTVMTIKPRKKGKTLRQALGGKSIPIAMGSPSDASSGTTVTVGFRVP